MTTRQIARPRLEGRLIPSVPLPRVGGGEWRARSYRGRRALTLYFLHPACADCDAVAAAIVPRYGDYAEATAEPAVIVAGTLSQAEDLRGRLALPFPVLADTNGAAGERHGLPLGAVGLLVSDRFGTPALWTFDPEGHDLPDQESVLRELDYLSHTCSGGCSTPIWPDE